MPKLTSMAAWKLPIEVLEEEILPRLPAKSLLRFKCITKFFQTLISTPEFVHTHLLHSLSSDDGRLLILIGEFGVVYSFQLDSPEYPPVKLSFPGAYCVLVVGSCNGLVCIHTYSSLVIFNPSTGIYKQIYYKKIPGSFSDFGFGFDDINDDYKVLRVSFSNIHSDDGRHVYRRVRRHVEVYSLKSGSWSFVESTPSPYSHVPMVKCALIDNHLVHWKWWNRSNDKYRIVCFDLRSHQWGEDVPLPDSYPPFRVTDLVHLKVLDGCLCLWTRPIKRVGVDVWVMKEYGVKDSWVKLASISNWDIIGPPSVNSPLAYAKGSSSEILVRVYSPSRLFWYNIRNKTCRVAEIHWVPARNGTCLCKGSLVSIPGGVRCQMQPLIEESRT